MSKRYGIRWNDDLNSEVKRVVKNYNAKVKRVENLYKGRSDVVIPERVSVKELKSLVGTKRDLSRELNSLKRFSKRGAEQLVDVPVVEDNIKITKWQKTEMNRRSGVINRTRAKRREQLEEIEMTSGGKSLGYSRGEFGMGKADKLSLKPTKAFTKKMDKWDIQKKARSLRKHSQSDYFNKSDQRLYDNYIKSLEDTYGPEAVKDLVEKIKKMDFNDFYKTFKSEPDLFEFSSDIPSDADIGANLEHLYSTWGVKRPSYKPKGRTLSLKKGK